MAIAINACFAILRTPLQPERRWQQRRVRSGIALIGDDCFEFPHGSISWLHSVLLSPVQRAPMELWNSG